MDYSSRLLYKAIIHPEIYNSNLDWDLKFFLQNQLDKLGGNFNDLLDNIMDYAILPEVEDYENAAKIRDYLKTLNV